MLIFFDFEFYSKFYKNSKIVKIKSFILSNDIQFKNRIYILSYYI